MIYLTHYHRYYLPNNCTLVVVGDIDPQEALTQIEATFGTLPAGPEPPKVTAKEPANIRAGAGWRCHREGAVSFYPDELSCSQLGESDAYPWSC